VLDTRVVGWRHEYLILVTQRAQAWIEQQREKGKSCMRAVVCDRYGPPEVQRLVEVELPVPTDEEALIRIHATTVNRTDCGWRGAHPFFVRFFLGLRRPKRRILGGELAGEIAVVGKRVTEFAVGDRVFGVSGFGAHAEYVCLRQDRPLTQMPEGMTFEKAAAVCDGAMAAFSCLRNADLRPGRRLLVYGASGSIGSAAVQVAKSAGAHVTAVCNTKNVELIRSLGADRVIDYTREKYIRKGVTYDVIFDAVGKTSFRRCRRALKQGGLFIETDAGFMAHAPLLALMTHWIGDKRVIMGITRYTKADLLVLKELIEAGKYRAVIDRTYPLEQVVEATRYVETGQKTGNVVLTVIGDRSL
jgi:NADPH:quinone reductase-like Zn-dependent oxidoreductase